MDAIAIEGVEVRCDVPPGFVADAPPTLDVGKLPGAQVIALHAARRDTTRVVVGCITAPSTHFVSGLEGLLLEKTTWLTLQTIGEPPRFRQTSFATRDEARPAVRDIAGTLDGRDVAMRHLLAFVGEDRRALVCTAVCTGEAGDATCPAVVASFGIHGALAPDPEPPFYVRALFWGADHPAQAVVVVGLPVLLVIGVVLARRRRFG